MFEIIQAYLERIAPLSASDVSIIRDVLIPSTLKKGEFLVREGVVAKYAAFVCEGFLRSYVIDNKGKEHILQFAPENWWISDKPGATPESPASVFIDAIEDSTLLLIDRAGHVRLMSSVPSYAASFLTGIQKRSEAKEKRIVHSLTATAEEKYNDFLLNSPGIAYRVPQHMLASYLGITPETVSRIRRKASSKK